MLRLFRLSDVGSMDFVLLSLEPVSLSALSSGRVRHLAIPGVVRAVEGRGRHAAASIHVARSGWQEISASSFFGSSASSSRKNT